MFKSTANTSFLLNNQTLRVLACERRMIALPPCRMIGAVLRDSTDGTLGREFGPSSLCDWYGKDEEEAARLMSQDWRCSDPCTVHPPECREDVGRF